MMGVNETENTEELKLEALGGILGALSKWLGVLEFTLFCLKESPAVHDAASPVGELVE